MLELSSMQKRVAIVEIGGSHDECILSQLVSLKEAGAWVVLCGTKDILEKNSTFKKYLDSFHEVTLPKSAIGDFLEMVRLNRWFKKNKIDRVIANTAQGGHIRNLCITSSPKIQFFGFIHTIKMLESSFTQSIISKKIKDYFVLNDTLKRYSKKTKNRNVYSFYPLNYPHFNLTIPKPENEFWIAIIGGVESRRKDLNGFIELAKLTPKNVHFHFLGKSKLETDEVHQFLKEINENKLSNRIKLFDNFLTEEAFDGYLQKTDAIFPLVHPYTPSADEYFKRQISGAINIAFSYKIPMLIHENYQDWEDFKDGVIFYNLSNFGERFSTFQTSVLTLKNQLIANPKFSAEFQNKHFAKIILS